MNDPIELTDEEYDTFMESLAEQRCQHHHGQSLCPPPPERAILLDLIAELRNSGQATITVGRALTDMADRAENRLKKLGSNDE